MQLELLLQPRPNQLRGGPDISKARHNVLRDCRALREARGAAKVPNAQHEAKNKSNFGNNDALQEWDESLSAPPFCNPGPRWTWVDSDLGSAFEALEQLPNVFENYFSRFPFKEIQTVDPKDVYEFGVEIRGQDSVRLEGCSMLDGFPLVPSKQDIGPNAHDELPEIRIDGTQCEEWILPYCRIPHVYSDLRLSGPSIWPTSFRLPWPRPEVPESILDSYKSNHSNFELAPPATEPTLLSGGDSTQTDVLLGNKPQNESEQFTGERSSQSSMDDVTSLMENHTISSGTRSSARTSEISSQKSSRHLSMRSDITITASAAKQQLPLPSEGGPPVVLPGAFPRFCCAQIDQNSLGLCRQDGLLCEHVTPVTSRFFTSRFGLIGVIYHRQESRDVNEVDLFGNSILHVAASLGAPVQYLIELIEQNANVYAKNKAGETFLHLIHVPTEGDDVCTLFDVLKTRNFDFSERDDHGQTCLHILTRSWHPQQYLVKVIRKLDSLGWPLLNSRDNLGHSLWEQRKHPFTQTASLDAAEDTIFRQSLDLNYEFNHERSAKSALESNRYTNYPTDQASVDTTESPQRYGHHAGLLKTINKAGEVPWFEDSDGNNGLHCLAEVAFYIPTSGNFKNQAQFLDLMEDEDSGSRRETYLDGLLAAGVDPNNYNKDGITPIMAFITHTHPTEDDETMTRILTKLIKAKANIHRRNRQGETALHLAVKFGRRAATNFLLKNGANVHARNKNGEGVLEIGHRALKACRKTNGDVTLYAQILLCMSLAMFSGAISTPTILREWVSVPKKGNLRRSLLPTFPGWI